MKSQRAYRLFLAKTLLFICLFAFTDNGALAANFQKNTATSDPIEDATVNLYCRLKVGKKIYSISGSGVFVDERGIILTNAHVAQYFLIPVEKGKVTGKCGARTGSPAKERYTVSILYFPSIWVEKNADQLARKEPRGTGETDFALLYVTGAKRGALPKEFPALSIGTDIVAHNTVTIAGYPTEGLDFEEIHKKLEMVVAPSTVTNTQGFGRNESTDVLTLAASAAGSPGVSGGPVVDDSNRVVGIVTTKRDLEGDRTLRAITLSYIDRTLESQTSLHLHAFLSGDLVEQADNAQEHLPARILKILTDSLLKKKS